MIIVKESNKKPWAIAFVSLLLLMGVIVMGEISAQEKISAGKEARPVKETIMTLEEGAMERWRKGDPWGFAEISAPDVSYFDTGTPSRLDGLEALKAEYAKRKGKIHYDVMEFINPKVQVHGDTAVLSYQFFSTKLNPDGSVASRTPWNCTEVFFKINGKWRIIHTH